MLRHPSRSWSRLASRLLAGAAVGVLAAGLAGGPALAEESAEPTSTADTGGGGGGAESPQLVGPQTAGTAGCAVPENLDEITGIAMTPAGLAVIEGGARQDPFQVEITTLDAACAPDPEPWGLNPLNPQDLTFANNTFYVCDCGDTDLTRQSVAMEKVVPGGEGGEIYRFAFPSGALNAKAMLIAAGDLPIFLATEASGVTGIFTAAQLPEENNQTALPLTRAGEWSPEATETPSPQGAGNGTVTGAALSPDGTRVVIRTYSDAYEYELTGGDIVTALQGDPIGVTPLPNEPQGEAITYSADGEQFITLSTRPDGSTTAPTLLTYERWIAPEVTVTSAAPTTAAPEGGGLLSRFTMSQLTQIIGAVGVVGIVLAIAGIIGIRRARRRRYEDDWDDDYDDDDDDYDDRRSRRGRRGRDRYGSREPAYSAGGYDDSPASGGYGPDYTGYQQGYAAQGYDQSYAGQDYTGYQQGYGAPGYADPGYAEPGYADPGYAADPSYGGQPGYGGQGGYDQGQYGGGYGEEFDPMDPRRR